jgi:hypothetical protein
MTTATVQQTDTTTLGSSDSIERDHGEPPLNSRVAQSGGYNEAPGYFAGYDPFIAGLPRDTLCPLD